MTAPERGTGTDPQKHEDEHVNEIKEKTGAK